MREFFRSLLAKYMFIILLAISLVQISYLVIAIFVSGLAKNLEGESLSQGSEGLTKIEEKWHAEAKDLQPFTSETIEQHFTKWKRQYEDASMFWVDEHGMLIKQMDVKESLPSEWSSAFTAKFIKERYDGDPFTVIAFVGKDESHGFIVFEIQREAFSPMVAKVYEQYGMILLFGVIFFIALFIAVSFLFFRGIRKRLLQLQDAMEIRDVDGLPIEIHVNKKDEIGQLEKTFNQMVFELRESKQREQEEEQLRLELIANLSHDLRTPLTKIRAQSYSIAKEELSRDGKEAIKALESSIVNIDRLIDNLMSYTLLMDSKYKFDPKDMDVIRFVRECLASWYPVFEKEGFEMEVQLSSFEKKKWMVDPIWLGRILDNLLQNVLRHAKSGMYIHVKTESTDKYDAIVISDRGKGMKHQSNEAGAGIGLSIVDMMVKGMNLDWDIASSENGTIVKIKKYK
ncbi:histidine kinase dimerization/phospho-acceptor domain-containing protein [Bacillus sp. FJAT-50079]|uniref:HAMP domain-containing sensor histidine kinase n=1 Tax=Bacillus sp. FJAT-50079 TaxID=2833577 RepID=UPI001BC9ABBC|nr:histidine kinase dimerization/phospho-acceptor domain-containing protein [Bacillus sp. FJAT-50079]MBS4207348.1 HAMP domain-containing protein [Bacillus sp. FJAT-50079]